ncbi:MAG TPA: GxxExxY protein [Gemmatimonadaceae bacterium]|nr:GxxExxY protein [Gemmatimonadaceae bacterium]
MPRLPDGKFKSLTSRIIGAAIEVHRHLGPGLLESTYEDCLEWELKEEGIAVARQVKVPLMYKGRALASSYRLDLLVDQSVIVDVKAVDHVADIHGAQILTYLRLTNIEVGLLINFNSAMVRDGIKRFVLPSIVSRDLEGG